MLLELVEGKAVPSAYAMTIDAFKGLKVEELSYIFFMLDPKSPYSQYEKKMRHDTVVEDLFPAKKTFKPSTKLQAALDKYDQLIDTTALRLLRSARLGAQKLESYFETVDLTLLDDRGKPIYAAKDLMSNLASMGATVDGLAKLEELVAKQEDAAAKGRGGVEIGRYNT